MKNQQLITIVFFAIVCGLLYKCYTKQIEAWVPYKQCPFGNWECAPDTQVYYLHNRYRKPYQYPWTFESSYPVVHQRHHS